MKKVITVQNLSKKFKVKLKTNSWFRNIFAPKFESIYAVNDISFNIYEGESVAFLGPNGAGKTTTTKMMTGLISPSSGVARVLGFTPFDRNHDFLKNIGLVMGNKAGLNWDLSARQSFELYKNIYQIPKKSFESSVKKLTNMLEVDSLLDRQVRKLSLGERMKFELIGSILHKPKILFLDEPTIGLDINAKQKVRDFLREIQRDSGITIILTSHDMDDVEKVSDRVIVVNHGKKVYDGKIEALNKKYQKVKYIKFFFESESQKKLHQIEFPAIESVSEKDLFVVYKVKKDDVPSFIAATTAKFNLVDIDIITTPLEDILKDIFVKT